MLQIYRTIKQRRLMHQRNGSGTFSLERLMEFLTEFGQDVEIIVRPTRERSGPLAVVVAPHHFAEGQSSCRRSPPR
jgi:hypothetical protein